MEYGVQAGVRILLDATPVVNCYDKIFFIVLLISISIQSNLSFSK